MYRGKETIYADVMLDIYSGTEKVLNFNLGNEVLGPAEGKKIKKMLDTKDMPPGNYLAEARVEYGGESEAKDSYEFRIGHLYVDIKEHTKEVYYQKINPYYINVSSEWKHQIRDVYANVTVFDVSGNTKKSFLTPPVTINGFQPYQLSGFFDTEGLELGNYETKISVYYSEQENSIKTEIKVIKEGISKLTFMIFIASSLIVIVIILIIVIKKVMNKKKKR